MQFTTDELKWIHAVHEGERQSEEHERLMLWVIIAWLALGNVALWGAIFSGWW